MVSATNLIVRERFGPGGPTIALNAHGDVVPPGEGWKSIPMARWRRVGRFTAAAPRCRESVSRLRFALLALKNNPAVDGAVELHLTCEESEATSAKWLLDEGISSPTSPLRRFLLCGGHRPQWRAASRESR
jgi:acetylornithine deacetylase/succinyl-diaminopimelate desuccinylase-like protein